MPDNFQKRLMTAGVLIVIFISVLYSGSPVLFKILIAAFLIVAAWEWSALAAVENTRYRAGFLTLVILMAAYVYHAVTPDWRLFLIIISLVTWLTALCLVIGFQSGKMIMPEQTPIRLAAGLVVILLAWGTFLLLYQGKDGLERILVLFILIWLVDSSAYFVGRSIGKHKLASHVSPAKTWEGFAGSLGVAVLVGLTYGLLMDTRPVEMALLLMVILVTTFFSLIGDLFISMLKRRVHIKDTGHLLPGHGGVLDRIDSLLAALPIFAAGIWLVGERL